MGQRKKGTINYDIAMGQIGFHDGISMFRRAVWIAVKVSGNKANKKTAIFVSPS